MNKLLRIIFEHRRQPVKASRLDEDRMQVAVARALAELKAKGRLEVELDAQREIKERVRAAA